MFVSTNSNSLAVGVICNIAVSPPTFSKPSPLPHVTKNPASPSLSLNTSFKYCISDLSCASSNFVSDDVKTMIDMAYKNGDIKTACTSGFS